jgi:hypothetical protein
VQNKSNLQPVLCTNFASKIQCKAHPFGGIRLQSKTYTSPYNGKLLTSSAYPSDYQQDAQVSVKAKE